jgi:hypothetical protein
MNKRPRMVAVILMSRVIATGVDRSDDRCWLGLIVKELKTMARTEPTNKTEDKLCQL